MNRLKVQRPFVLLSRTVFVNNSLSQVTGKSSVLLVGKDDFELLMLPSLPPQSWDYSCVLPCLAYVIKLRALCVLGKPSYH